MVAWLLGQMVLFAGGPVIPADALSSMANLAKSSRKMVRFWNCLARLRDSGLRVCYDET